MAVLRKLDSYRGQSRFTTWAHKFRCSRPPRRCEDAVSSAASSDEADGWARFRDGRALSGGPSGNLGAINAIRDVIAEASTRHQRGVLVAPPSTTY